MAVAAFAVTSNNGGGSGTSFNTASITANANELYLISINSRSFTGALPVVPVVTGGGLGTWTQVNTIQYDTGGPSLKRGSVFYALSASPGAGAVVNISFGTDSQTDVVWTIERFTGVDTTTPIVQSVTAKDETGSATSITATLAAFGSVNNATYGAFVNVAPTNGVTPSAGSGFTALNNQSDALINTISQFKSTNDTSVDGTLSGASFELGMIALEIKAASTSNTYTFSAGGTITFSGGVSSLIRTRAVVASGTITFTGGITRFIRGRTVVTGGTITFSGTAPEIRTRTVLPSGNISFSGGTTPLHVRTILPSGNITFSGNAPFITTFPQTYTFSAGGVITFTGTAAEIKTRIFPISGNITFSGTAPYQFIPTGGGGSVTTKLPLIFAGK